MKAWSSALRSVILSAVPAKNQSEPAPPVNVSEPFLSPDTGMPVPGTQTGSRGYPLWASSARATARAMSVRSPRPAKCRSSSDGDSRVP